MWHILFVRTLDSQLCRIIPCSKSLLLSKLMCVVSFMLKARLSLLPLLQFSNTVNATNVYSITQNTFSRKLSFIFRFLDRFKNVSIFEADLHLKTFDLLVPLNVYVPIRCLYVSIGTVILERGERCDQKLFLLRYKRFGPRT